MRRAARDASSLIVGGGEPVGSDDILVAASQNGAVRIWSLSRLLEPVLIYALSRNSVNESSMAISRDGRLLAAGGGDGNIRLWDMSNLYQLQLLATLSGHGKAVKSVTLNEPRRGSARSLIRP